MRSGSHKACMDMPDTDPADPRQHKGVVHPLMEPGDVIFFMWVPTPGDFVKADRSAFCFLTAGGRLYRGRGGATAHGAWATHTDKPRRAALFNYLSKDVHYFTRVVPKL